MRPLRVFVFDIVAPAVIIGWLLWKYPEAFERSVPWLILGVLWHLTLEFCEAVYDKEKDRDSILEWGKRPLTWVIVFLVGGLLSLGYWQSIRWSLAKLASTKSPKSGSVVPKNDQIPDPVLKPSPSDAAPKVERSEPQPPRRPMRDQAAMLKGWIDQMAARTRVKEMWLSQIFKYQLDNIPDGPEVDVPKALRHLADKRQVEILETAVRPYQAWWGESFKEDIRFKVNPHIHKTDAPPTVQQQGKNNIAQFGDNNQATIVEKEPLKLEWSASPAASTGSLAYSETVTVRSNVEFHPVSLIIVCDEEIESISPGGLFIGRKDWGIAQQNNRIGFVYYENPPLAPGVALVIGVSSSKQFSVLEVKPATIEPRKNVLD